MYMTKRSNHIYTRWCPHHIDDVRFASFVVTRQVIFWYRYGQHGSFYLVYVCVFLRSLWSISIIQKWKMNGIVIENTFVLQFNLFLTLLKCEFIMWKLIDWMNFFSIFFTKDLEKKHQELSKVERIAIMMRVVFILKLISNSVLSYFCGS